MIKSKTIKQVLKIIFFFLLGIGILWLFQRKLTAEETAEIGKAFSSVNYYILLLVLVFGLFSNLLRTLRWQLLIEPIEHKPRTLNTFLSVLVAYFANLGVPRLGEVVRCTMLYRYEEIPMQKSLGTVVMERIIDTISLLLVFLLAFWIEYDTINNYVSNTILAKFSSQASLFEIIVYAGIIFIAVCAILYLLYRKFKSKLTSNAFLNKIVNIFKGFADGLLSLRKIKNIWLFILYSALIWVCYLLMVYFAFLSMPELSQSGLSLSLVALAMGTIGIIITPGGIGIYPVIIAETLLVFGISKTVGYTAGWIAWGSQTAMIIVAGLISLLLLPILNKKAPTAKTATAKTASETLTAKVANETTSDEASEASEASEAEHK